MRNVKISNRHMKATNAYHEELERAKNNEQQAAEAEYCLNYCAREDCKGTCEEFKRFKKTLKITIKHAQAERRYNSLKRQ